MLKFICKELGVEVNKEWLGNNGNKYMIDFESGIMCYSEELGTWFLASREDNSKLLTGKLKPVWKPESGEQYFSPFIRSELEARRYFVDVWENSVHDNFLFENNLVFKTKKEAISHANKLLKASQKEGQNES